MSLLDTIDGSFMNFAYGWAFSKPVRKVYYNIIITGLSVAVSKPKPNKIPSGYIFQDASIRRAIGPIKDGFKID